MPKAIICIGIPASGKTTWAKDYVKEHPNSVIISRDDIRASQGYMFGVPGLEDRVTYLYRLYMSAAIHVGLTVICADTNLYDPFRRSLISFAHFHGADVEIKLFDIELNEAIRRDALRPAPVGEEVVKKFHDRLMRMDYLTDEFLPVPKCSK